MLFVYTVFSSCIREGAVYVKDDKHNREQKDYSETVKEIEWKLNKIIDGFMWQHWEKED